MFVFLKQTFEQNAKPPDLKLSKDFDSVKSFEIISLFAGEAGGMKGIVKGNDKLTTIGNTDNFLNCQYKSHLKSLRAKVYSN